MTEEKAHMITELFLKGESINEISRRVHSATRTINKYIKEQNLVREETPPIDLEKAIELFKEGKSYAKIAKALSCSRDTVSRHLKANGYAWEVPDKVIKANRENGKKARENSEHWYVCQNCGKKYKAKKKNRDKYCSRECAFEAHKMTITCKQCGKEYKLSEGWQDQNYCSKECHDKAFTFTCEICGKTLIGTSPNQKYCSRACRLEASRRRSSEIYRRKFEEKYSGKTLICKVCGKEFVPEYGSKRRSFCSDECKEEAMKEHRRKRDKSAEKARRRARKRNCEIEKFTKKEIFERDNWICQICGKPVDKNLKYPDPYVATLDHIVPLAKGGNHTRDNVQLAHFICNSYKRDLDQATAQTAVKLSNRKRQKQEVLPGLV